MDFLMQSGYKMFWDLTKNLKKWMELIIKVIMEEKVTLKDKGEKRLCGLYQKIIGWMKKGNVEDFFMKPGAWPNITFKHNIKWMEIACFTNVKMEHQIKFKNALRNATQISIMFILKYIWSEYMTLES